MKRQTANFPLKDIPQFKLQMLSWANRFNICCFLDNHGYSSPYQTVECLMGIGAAQPIISDQDFFSHIDHFYNNQKDWLFGHLSYNLTQNSNQAPSLHPNPVGFPEAFFFQPEIVIQLTDQACTISSLKVKPKLVFNEILTCPLPVKKGQTPVSIRPAISKEKYLHTIEQLLTHIKRGDCYEINFCQEFFAENTTIDPLEIYSSLTTVSPAPFASFYKLNDKYLLCASPERYLQKKGSRLISQPIKGTIPRNLTDPEKDTALRTQLQQSKKDISENVMVVDLVRNDLSRICTEGSVKVEELFGIYSFPQVHQMISTISGKLKQNTDFSTIIKASFPMGSMTGAPKNKVMELIEQYESTNRGIYSGALGYISPTQDFDFNVVIRSILYNAEKKYLSYLVGGGITCNSDPQKEYEECLLKAKAMRTALEGI